MVFRRRSSRGQIIDSKKHEVRYSNLLEAGATVREVEIALAVDRAVASDTQVKAGCVIKAIFFELNWNVEGNITTVIDWCLVKTKEGQTATSILAPASPNVPARSQRFLWGMEMPAGINNSSAIKRIGTLLIPKGKQRMAESDKWSLLYFFAASGSIADACGHFIYKEYR